MSTSLGLARTASPRTAARSRSSARSRNLLAGLHALTNDVFAVDVEANNLKFSHADLLRAAALYPSAADSSALNREISADTLAG